MPPAEAMLASFTLRSPSVTLHEPIFVDFSIQNRLEESMRFDLGPDRKDHFQFSIVEPGGASTWAHRRAMEPESADRAYALGHVLLRPSEAYHGELLLNEWLCFDRPGRYQVGAMLADTLWAASGTSLGRLPAEVLSLRIARRSAKRLARVCEALLDIVIGSSDIRARNDAAIALSHVEDPVAVPYLVRALIPGRSAWQHALRGLGRIRNAEAVEALRSASRGMSDEPGARSLARSILHRLEGE